MIKLKRVYEPADENDGQRVLVDRLWPRALSKDKAKIDWWLKEIAPSDNLRKWFGHEPEKWAEFKQQYFRELDDRTDIVNELEERATSGRITLLFAAKDERFNNAVALKEYLENRGRA
jgi:uncharacterized protein YeaO (DUF488 family)